MRDSSKLLNFDLNRQLLFTVFRPVEFPTQRDLLFDLDRSLSFDSRRVLPFGKKGVDFRQFVCGRCGVVVPGDAQRCPNCEGLFASEDEPITSTTRVRPSENVAHSKMKDYFGEEYRESVGPAAKRRPPTYHCNSCGNNLRYITARGKWYCDRCRIYYGTASRGGPKKPHRFTPHAGGGPGGVKFAGGQSGRRAYPSEVVMVEDLNKKRRGR